MAARKRNQKRAKRTALAANEEETRTNYASAFISTANLPKNLDQLRDSWVGDRYTSPRTPVDTVLVQVGASGTLAYSVPARARKGDIIFFHYAARAIAYTKSLRRQAELQGKVSTRLEKFFAWATLTAEENAGGIYAYGTLVSDPYLIDPEPNEGGHWRNRLYADIANIQEMEEVLYIDENVDAVPQPISGITPLSQTQFQALKERLETLGNRLHPDLANTVPGKTELAGLTQSNWREKACGEDVQFSCEADLRGYFADFVLQELKDPETIVYREVRCLRKKGPRQLGSARADYVITVEGRWLPVEVKLTLASWPDVTEQVQPYIAADAYEFIDAPGHSSKPREAHLDRAWSSCLVLDRDGLYIIAGDEFVAGKPGKPFWTRADLRAKPVESLRPKLLDVLELNN